MLRVGDRMPSFQFIDLDGAESDLGKVISGKSFLFLWLRHFGCRFYQEAKLKLPELSSKMQAMGVNLVCVVQGTSEKAKVYWPFDRIPVIPDPNKRSYRMMGLARTSLLKIVFPNGDLKTRRKAAASIGCSMNKQGTREKHSDILQLPGAALVGPDGVLLWIHRGRHTGDLDLGDGLVHNIAKVTPLE